MSVSKIAPLDYFGDITTMEDIPKNVQLNTTVKKYVDDGLKKYSTINVTEAMKNLATVGDLLKVANAASYGFKSSVPIKEILGNYQTLINDTVVTTSTFVYNCIACISLYKNAIKFAERNRVQKSFEIVSRAADKAKEMAEQSDKLVKFAENLADKALKAITSATDDHVKTVEELKKNQQKQAELEAKSASLKSDIAGLKSQITEMKDLADEAGKRADEDRKWANITRIIGAVAQPVAQLAGPLIAAYSGAPPTGAIKNILNKDEKKNEDDLKDDPKDDMATKVSKKKKKLNKQKKEKEEDLKKKEEELETLEEKEKKGTITNEEKEKKSRLSGQIDDIKKALKDLGDNIKSVTTDIANELKESANKQEDKEMAYRKLKNQYQDLERKSNAELAEAVELLKSLALSGNDLKVGIKSLELVVTTMGKVKTVFENTRLYWLNVEAHCRTLSDVSEEKDLSTAIDNEDDLVDYVNTIKKGGMNWLSLASINQIAFTSITSIKKNVDDVMNNLPGKDEALEIVKSCSDELKKMLEEENKKIDETKKEIESADKKKTSSVPSQ